MSGFQWISGLSQLLDFVSIPFPVFLLEARHQERGVREREKSPGSQARIDGKDGWRLLALGDRLIDGKPAMQLISGDSRSI